MKAQVSMEMLTTLGLFLLLLVPILFIALYMVNNNNSSLASLQATSSARLVADTINEVYLEGDGSSRTILVAIPNGDLIIKGNAVIIDLGNKKTVRYILTELEFSEEHINGLINLRVYNERGNVRIEVLR